MKKQVRLFINTLIILIALGAALFSQRVLVAEWFAEKMKPELPVAVSFEEATKGIEEPEEGGEVALPQEDVAVAPDQIEPAVEEVIEEDVPLTPSPTTEPATLPASFNLAVPFFSQAPFADWSLPFKEACEEASLYMVDAYLQGVSQSDFTPAQVKEGLLSIVEFEKQLFGYYEDTTVEQVATLAEAAFGYGNLELIDDPSVDQIKQHLAAGRPVIVPAAGRMLGNPNFQQPGPLYHMLVIRGYTDNNQFITNDPGTRKGEAFLYNVDTLMNAMHDWNGEGEIEQGKKRVLVIYPN